LQRLPALLRHLPPETFTTFLLINDPQCDHSDCANFCSLLVERSQAIHGADDDIVLDAIRDAAPDVLIDLDAYGPAERLQVFLKAEVPHKFLWGEAPMPPLSPQCRVLAGARLADSDALPFVTLPEMGEYYDLPEWPIAPPSSLAASATSPTRFGCLTPAACIDREGWRLFAAILDANPESTLLINLQYLGKAAQEFIKGEFTWHGIAVERLRFASAQTAKELCRFWQETDLGLHPPTDAGDLALPACLWMGRPYLALASPLPWSRRPAALLELAGAESWVQPTWDAYIEYARQTPPAPNPEFRARMKAARLDDPVAFAQGFAASIMALLA
jgi:predicted O-linked N-acetylglucosamine transferase (SPINDLY family)